MVALAMQILLWYFAIIQYEKRMTLSIGEPVLASFFFARVISPNLIFSVLFVTGRFLWGNIKHPNPANRADDDPSNTENAKETV